MHVAFIVTNYPPHQGGVEQHLATLGRLLVQRDVACTVICLADRPGVREEDGVRVHTLRRRLDVGAVLAVPEPRAWRAAAAMVRAGDVTHISTHTRFFPMSALGVRLADRLALPSVHTEHGAGFVASGRPAIDLAARAVDRTMGRRVLRGATEVLAVSDRSAAFVRTLSGRVAVPFGSGVELGRWRGPEPVAARPRLVFVGRLAREKGWRDFLAVLAGVRDLGDLAAGGGSSDAGLEGVIIGDGPEAEAVRRAVAELPAGIPVRVTGALAPDAVAAELAGAVYVNPSRAAEGFQLTQLEAAAAGAQVVTYDVGAARELAAAGAPVSVVTPGDVVGLTVAARAALTAPQAAASLEALRQWDWDALADRYVDVLKRVAPGRRGGSV